MADGTAIEWTEATWNPVAGCSVVSPGCKHCYAMKMAARIEAMQAALGKPTHYAGLTRPGKAGAVWTGKMAVAPDETMTQPLRWKKPRRIFVNSMSDLFHEDVADETIDRVFAVMALCPQHTFQILTKRAKRMREWFEERWQGTPAQRYKVGNQVFDMPAGGETGREHQVEIAVESVLEGFPHMIDTDNDALWTDDGDLKIRQYKWPLPNVWLGVSTEDQERANERIPDLLATPAAVRFLSCEPLLGPVNLRYMRYESGDQLPAEMRVNEERCSLDALRGVTIWPGSHYVSPSIAKRMRLIGGQVFESHGESRKIDLVIVGGESGPRSRPFDIEWARSIVAQCKAAGVAAFVKQLGARPYEVPLRSDPNYHRPLRLKNKKGGDTTEWPEDLRVRELPK